jgi:hypothetical protein
VRFIQRGTKRTHYAVTIPSVSGDPARVSVHRTSGNISCLTHNTANRCEHVAAALRSTSRRTLSRVSPNMSCVSGWTIAGYTIVLLWVGATVGAFAVGLSQGYGGKVTR